MKEHKEYLFLSAYHLSGLLLTFISGFTGSSAGGFGLHGGADWGKLPVTAVVSTVMELVAL